MAPTPCSKATSPLIVLILSGIFFMCHGLNNGVALTPILGYNTWNYFGCSIDEKIVRETVDALVDLGLAEAGYTYMNLDDCWHHRVRSPSGELQASPKKFPSGMKALGDYIHSKGLKFGIYSDAGLFTCQVFPGSLGHELQDAQTFAEWGVDYLKYDNCFANNDNAPERYQAMRDALNKTGRPIVFSMCDWGVAAPWEWGMEVGNSWRVDDDVAPYWDSILRSLDAVRGLAKYGGPGGWNDPDMLEVGNGQLTLGQQRAHFALWSLVKSPLLIGTDLRKIPADSLEILKNQEILALNQDPLGVPGDMIMKEGLSEIWAAPLVGGARGVVLFSRQRFGPVRKLRATWEMLGYPADMRALVRDLFQGQELGLVTGGVEAEVGNVDVVVLKITPEKSQEELDQWRPWTRTTILDSTSSSQASTWW